MMNRQYSIIDSWCIAFDRIIRALNDNPVHSGRAYPPLNNVPQLSDSLLSAEDLSHSAGIMRINHSGEIAAQALYHGHELAACNACLKKGLSQAAVEEGDHLVWCYKRLQELDSHTSYLKFLWYGGGVIIGILAGFAGEKWILGFIAETEMQVMRHLTSQIEQLPLQDNRSRIILEQMYKDENQHREAACAGGAPRLPVILTKAMGLLAKIMVKTSYWL